MNGEKVAIRHCYFAHGEVWLGPRYERLEDLQVVMDTANRHFSTTPERVLGGPSLTPRGRK